MENTSQTAGWQPESALPPPKRKVGRSSLFTGGAVLALMLVTAFVLSPQRLPPSREFNGIPLPFGNAEGVSLAGSVTYIATQGGLDIYQVDYPSGTDNENVTQDKVLLVRVPDDSGVTTVPFDAAVTLSGAHIADYFGYKYVHPNADVEIAHKNDPVFKDRFPGIFFASQKARDNDAEHGNALAGFESANDVDFVKTDASVGGVRLERNSLYVLIMNEPNPVNLRVRGIVGTCSDGWRSGSEDCDDGNLDIGDGCTELCEVEDGYTCTTGVPNICTPDAECGNGLLDSGETCDDGNIDDDDGCSATCTIESGYICNANTPNVCTKTCGDGTRGSGEACDDGNEGSGDGCSETCTIESDYTCDTASPNVCTPAIVCGDNVCHQDERLPVYMCSPHTMCQNPTYCPDDCIACGNSMRENGELCDDGGIDIGDGCSEICEIEDGYTCNEDIPNICTEDAICGNGFEQADETCDDGNTDDDDGCSATCETEDGYTCDNTMNPNVCTKFCGDGVRQVAGGGGGTSEECDDGNEDSGDGCSEICEIEDGYTCTNSIPGVCTGTCSDGIRQANESCDDGNLTNADGCDDTCTVEDGFTCDETQPNNVCTPE
jgi:cysteine-rich repeat protein